MGRKLTKFEIGLVGLALGACIGAGYVVYRMDKQVKGHKQLFREVVCMADKDKNHYLDKSEIEELFDNCGIDLKSRLESEVDGKEHWVMKGISMLTFSREELRKAYQKYKTSDK